MAGQHVPCPFCRVRRCLWVSCDLGKGRSNGERSWVRERGEREPRTRPWNQSNCFHSSREYLELYSPKLFGCPSTAFHCFRVSQRWVFEPRRAKPQTPPSSRSGKAWTQVISDGLISLRQQKPVSLNWVCLFSEIQEPQATYSNWDPRSVVMGAPQSRIWSHLDFQMPGELVPTDRVSPAHVASCKRRLSRIQARSSAGPHLMWNFELLAGFFQPPFFRWRVR